MPISNILINQNAYHLKILFFYNVPVLCLFQANWYQAVEFCRTHGMQLLSIETREEENLINLHLKEIGELRILGPYN